MRRHGRRHASDYLENEELNETYGEYEEFDQDVEEVQSEIYEENISEKKSIWVKIGKIAVVILVLIALFFISMKVTEIFLDRNQEPEYGSDAPAYSDTESQSDEDIPAINEEPEDEEKMEEYKEEDTTPVKQPEEDKKPEEKSEQTKPSQDKPQDSQKPTEKPAEKPQETQKPSTEPAPSKPSKPLITPGNPAA